MILRRGETIKRIHHGIRVIMASILSIRPLEAGRGNSVRTVPVKILGQVVPFEIQGVLTFPKFSGKVSVIANAGKGFKYLILLSDLIFAKDRSPRPPPLRLAGWP